MLVAARTTPGHSWANPVMPLLNFAIQNVAVARELSELIDKKFHSYNTMADICKLANAVLYLNKA